MENPTSQRRIVPGQTVYLVVSRLYVREAVVRRREGSWCLIQFANAQGGIRVRADRLYPTRAAAEQHLRKNQLSQGEVFYGWHNVPFYMT